VRFASAAKRQSLKIEEIKRLPKVMKNIKKIKSLEVPSSLLIHFHIKIPIQKKVITNPAAWLYDCN